MVNQKEKGSWRVELQKEGNRYYIYLYHHGDLIDSTVATDVEQATRYFLQAVNTFIDEI